MPSVISGKNYAVYVVGDELRAIDIDGRTAQQVNCVVGSDRWYATIASSPGRAVNHALTSGFLAPVGAKYEGKDGKVTYLGKQMTTTNFKLQATIQITATRMKPLRAARKWIAENNDGRVKLFPAPMRSDPTLG